MAGRGAAPKKVKVSLHGGSEAYDAEVVGFEAEKDLAVLRIQADNLPAPIELASSAELCVGQSVLAIGNPFGLDYSGPIWGLEPQSFRSTFICSRVRAPHRDSADHGRRLSARAGGRRRGREAHQGLRSDRRRNQSGQQRGAAARLAGAAHRRQHGNLLARSLAGDLGCSRLFSPGLP